MKQHKKIIKKQKNGKTESNNDYLNDLEEWSENRYNPGFYTGAQMPPYIKRPKKPYGIWLIISGIIQFVLGYVARVSSSETILVFLIFIGAMLSLIAGLFIVTKKT